MTIDQVIALAASIGACLSAIAAFLAVRQVSIQRESSYRPELVIARTKFECIANPVTEGKIPDIWVVYDGNEAPKDYFRQFCVPLRNVGLGAAKGIQVEWSFPIEQLVSAANELAQKSLIPAYFEFENEMLSLKSEGFGHTVHSWANQNVANIDFVLPAPVDKTPVELQIPSAYVHIVSALVFFAFNVEDFGSFPEVPPLTANLRYFDIGGRALKSSFTIDTNIVAVVNKGETFSGYVECRNHT